MVQLVWLGKVVRDSVFGVGSVPGDPAWGVTEPGIEGLSEVRLGFWDRSSLCSSYGRCASYSFTAGVTVPCGGCKGSSLYSVLSEKCLVCVYGSQCNWRPLLRCKHLPITLLPIVGCVCFFLSRFAAAYELGVLRPVEGL